MPTRTLNKGIPAVAKEIAEFVWGMCDLELDEALASMDQDDFEARVTEIIRLHLGD